jgi:predicted metal-dependent HD superfamily phosphohydrolase
MASLFDNAAMVELALVHYRQPHRFYHDAAHVQEMMALARTLQLDLSPAEELAVLWHDAVYVPGADKGLNEKLSAKLMLATAANGPDFFAATDKATLATAERIIIETTHAGEPSAEAARVIDLDLYRLGAPWPEFDRHGHAIEREFRVLHDSPEKFWTARASFYRSMLQRPHIFATPLFRERYEAQARDNLKRGAEAASLGKTGHS